METNNNSVVESPETVPAVRDSYLRRHYFPEGFVVGSGTSAYQVKGAADSGGKGRSSWDDFTRRTPGLTYKNKTVMTMGKNSTVNSTNDNIESEKKTASTYAVVEPYDALKIPLTKILTDFQKHLRERGNHMLGFPCNQNCEHYLDLSSFLVYKINNVGDPFKESNYGVQSKKFEVGVLHWFSELWEIPKDEYWGYVTNGGTEGNLEALILGRESLPDGILYTSEDTHYSVFKAVRLYRMKCEKIKSLPSGEIDCSHLREKLLQNKDKPAIINVTIGTTFKGAIDNVDLVINTLEECGFSEDRFYIHCDAALYGLITPFIQKESKVISFKKRIASVSVSGHKLLGSPIPSGVVITRKKYIDNFSNDVEYIGSVDNTISGSRNGLTPLFLWYTLNLKGREGIQQDVEKCLANALYLRDRLQDIGINAMLNEMSIIVIFDKPSDERFIKYWQLSTEGNMAHVVVLPHVTIEMLDSFVNDFVMISKRS